MALTNKMLTSNPICEYPFSWTVTNFHLTSLTVRGAEFLPFPGYSESFCFELQYVKHTRYADEMFFKLISLNVKENPNLTVKCIFTMKNTKKQLFGACDFAKYFPVKDETALYSYYISTNKPLFMSHLEDGKLILEGNLTFSGYNMTSTIHPLPQNVSRNCTCTELVKDFKSMYESGLGSDVAFAIGNENIRAHKLILSNRSEVFAKMFQHDMLEKNTNTVVIKDVDCPTFKNFLLFLYTGVVDDKNYEPVLSLYSVAEKYQVKSLQEACATLCIDKLSVENACHVLHIADLHRNKELKESVKFYIKENFLEIAGSVMWCGLLSENHALAQEVLDFIKPK